VAALHCAALHSHTHSVSTTTEVFAVDAADPTAPPSSDPASSPPPQSQVRTSAQGEACTPFRAITTGTTLATVSNCDDCGEIVALPFTFMWLGAYPITQVYVTSNGAINIDLNDGTPSTSSQCCSATPISASSTSHPSSILVAHEDLNPGSSATGLVVSFYDTISGSFTISYQNVPFYGGRSYCNASATLWADGTVDLAWGECCFSVPTSCAPCASH
jgi:hypothetical protein